MDVASTATGAHYASILACLPTMAKIDEAQNLGLNCALFDRDGSPHHTNSYRHLIMTLHEEMSRTYGTGGP